jgi:hypothetical protein
VKRRLGYLPENAPAYPEMTVEEFLGFIAEVRGFRAAPREGPGRARGRASPTWTPCAARRSRRSPRATSSGSASPRRSSTTPRPSSWTSRPTAWTRTRRTRCGPHQEHGRGEGRHPLDPHPRGGRGHLHRVIIISRGRIVADETPAQLQARKPGARLDEIFRSLTQVGRMKQVPGPHLQARVRSAISARRSPTSSSSPSSSSPSPSPSRASAASSRRGSRASTPTSVLPVALPLHRAGGRHAPLVGGEALRHGRAPLHAAGDDARGRDRQVPRRLGLPRARDRSSASRWRSPIGYLGSPDWGVVATSYLGAS